MVNKLPKITIIPKPENEKSRPVEGRLLLTFLIISDQSIVVGQT